MSIPITVCRWHMLLLLCASTFADETAIPVNVKPLSALLSPHSYSAPASVVPLNRPRLAAEVSGRVMHIPVRVGQQVDKDELLVELDCSLHEQREQTAQAAFERAQAQLKFAGQQLQRANNLKQKDSISAELVDQRRTDALIAQADARAQSAQMAMARIDAEHCLILAPFDALIAARLASEGDLASPGTPLVELVQLDHVEVSAAVRSNEAETLSADAHLHFEYQEQNLPLTLRALPALVDERTRTRDVRLEFVKARAPVGAAGRLVWQTRKNLLPAHLLTRRGDSLGVLIARAGQAEFVALPMAREGQPAHIDLPGNTLVITEGRQRLAAGDAIEVQSSP